MRVVVHSKADGFLVGRVAAIVDGACRDLNRE